MQGLMVVGFLVDEILRVGFNKSCRRQRSSPDLCFATTSVKIYDP